MIDHIFLAVFLLDIIFLDITNDALGFVLVNLFLMLSGLKSVK